MTSEQSRRTLRHYEVNAARFWEGTRDHDVAQNIDALLAAVPASPAGFCELDCYYRPPGRPRSEQPWLAMTWRRTP